MKLQATAPKSEQRKEAAGTPNVRVHVLVVDDDELVRFTLRERMASDGYTVTDAATAAAALEAFDDDTDVVLLDIRLPDMSGLKVLQVIRHRFPDVPVILLTAHSSVDQAVRAMQDGAFHYAKKPCDLAVVSGLVSQALEQTAPARRLRRLRSASGSGLAEVVGDGRAMRAVKAQLAKVSASATSTVLLTGESGTGKDLLARAIHSQSARTGGPFINITCSALPESLLESELFGHERGAFTDAHRRREGLLEQAACGTVFLDEIGETSIAFQAKLLRFLEEKSFRRVGGVNDIRPDVRIVAATNQDLVEAMKTGRFREDLFYRLAVVHIVIPPLREREGDLEPLIQHFIDKFSREFDSPVRGLTAEAFAAMRRHHWPGNVRELRNAIERAVLFATGPLLGARDLQFTSPDARENPSFTLPNGGVDLRKLELDLVKQALDRARGNQSRAATLLGMNRDQIRYRIHKFDLK